jgi:hypothetical protein
MVTTIRIGVHQLNTSDEVSYCYNKENCHHPGFEIEIILAVMRILKWNFTFVKADTYGYQYDETDSTKWNGLVGKLLFIYKYHNVFT